MRQDRLRPQGRFRMLVESHGDLRPALARGPAPGDRARSRALARVDEPPGRDIKITITKPLFGDDITKWLILLGVIMIIIGSVSYSTLLKSKKQDPSSDSTEKRDSLIKEIAKLDDSYEAGDIEESEYRKLREEKKNKLIYLTNKPG